MVLYMDLVQFLLSANRFEMHNSNIVSCNLPQIKIVDPIYAKEKWCKFSPTLIVSRMTNLNMEVVSTPQSYVMLVRRETPRVRTYLVGHGQEGQVHGTCVNGSPKSGLSSYKGDAFFCNFIFFTRRHGNLNLKLNRFRSRFVA